MKTESKAGGPGGADQQRVKCKNCGSEWKLQERMMIGEVLDCADCQVTLEVSSLEPLELIPFRKIEETEDDLVGFDLL